MTPISGFPELLPAERLLELHVLDVIREVFELHGFAPLETRAVEPVDRLLGKGGDADKEIYGVSRLAGDDTRAGCRARACTSTSPSRSRATSSRTPEGSPSRSGATRSRRSGAASGPGGRLREFTQADIDVVDVGELSRRTSRPRCRSSSPRSSAGLPVGEFRIQVNNRKIPEGFYLGIGLDDVAGTLRIVDKLDKIGAGQGHRDARRGGAPREAGRPGAWPWRRSAAPTCRSWMPCAPWAWSTRPSTRASTPSPRSSRGAWTGTRGARRRPAGRPRTSTTTPAPSTRRSSSADEAWGSVCSGGRYDSLASDGRTTYPGVGISIGVTRLVHLLVAKRGLTASRSTPAAVLVASSTRRAATRPDGRDRPARARHPVRGRAQRGEVRQADPVRRPARHPVRLVPGCRERRRPGQGHPLRRAGRRRRRHVAVPAGRPAARVVTPSSRPRRGRQARSGPGRSQASP